MRRLIVQSGVDLISQQHARAGEKGTQQAHTGQLTAGEGSGFALELNIGQEQGIQAFAKLLVGRASGAVMMRDLQRPGHEQCLTNRVARQNSFLMHISHLPTPHLRGHGASGNTVELQSCRAVRAKLSDSLQKARFTRARRAGDVDNLAGEDVEGQVIEHLNMYRRALARVVDGVMSIAHSQQRSRR